MQISTILASTQETIFSQTDSKQNTLHAAFFNRLPKDEAYTDYKESTVNNLYIIAQIFLTGEKTRKK